MARATRTQAERVEETRGALLAATVSSLADVGYAATTTRGVAERAGVSRGAQTHHFPTKADLVAAAVEHLLATQLGAFRSAMARLPDDQRDLRAAFDMLWTVVRSPVYAALLEVMVAARTDHELARVLRTSVPLFEAEVVELALETFPFLDEDEVLARDVMTLAVSMAQGAAIARAAGFGEADRAVRVVRGLLGLVRTDNLSTIHRTLQSLSESTHGADPS